MKKILLFSLVILSKIILSQATAVPSQYCGGLIPTPGSTADEKIGKVEIVGTVINNQSTYTNCNGYEDFTNIIGTLNPGSTYTIIINGYDCPGSAGTYPAGISVFIDYNDDKIFQIPTERVVATTNTTTFPAVPGTNFTFTFTVPSTGLAQGVPVLMRVSAYENDPGNTHDGCTVLSSFGQVEDYSIFLGKKTWDLSPIQVVYPDTISFCGQEPVPFFLKITSLGNQPVDQGRVDLYIKGLNGSTTNIHRVGAFSESIKPKNNLLVYFDEISFPKDEPLEFTFVTYNIKDSFHSNDTFRKVIQVYKNPSFTLKTDSVCTGDFAQVAVQNISPPSFILWSNQSIDSNTSYQLFSSDTSTQFVFDSKNVTISRGWKCNIDTQVIMRINPLPTLKLYNDTTLCAGQSAVLRAVSDANTFFWKGTATGTSSSTKNMTVGALNDNYTMLATHSATGCFRMDSVQVKAVTPTGLTKINDTTCIGGVVQVGVFTKDSNYTFKWLSKGAFTPLIYDTPTSNSTYTLDWYYKNCHDKTTVSSKVNPLPTVTASVLKQHICQGYNTTISVSGALKYQWNNGSTSTSQVVSPTQLTYYHVTGTDINGCVNTSKIGVYVHKPSVEVFSNKYYNNVCKGDSVTLYSHGAKSYEWNQGLKNDSIHYFIPNESTDYTVIGTDEFGCKDTNMFRLSVRPSFKVTTVKDKKGCTGDEIEIWASGGKGATYQWGGGLGTDSFAIVKLGNSTQYTVSVTSADSCQIIKTVPVDVWSKPVARASDATTCSGIRAEIEASGGVDYEWSTGTTGSILADNPTATKEYTVTVTNEAGCKDSAIGTIFVIVSDTIKFKTPIDSYICPNIPVTLVATPYGGVWDGIYVSGNKWDISKIDDTIASVFYIYLDPTNGCEMRKEKVVKIIHDCKAGSQISGILDENQWKAYPNPFDDHITIEVNSGSTEEATISLYDFSGRKLITQLERLKRGINKVEISNLKLAAGTYYIELETEHVNRQMKLIKQ